MFVFHSATVDGSSVGSADDGTNLDMAAFPIKNLKCITAGNTSIELTFNETGMFNAKSHVYGDTANNVAEPTYALEQSLVIITCTNAATATSLVKLICEQINSTSPLFNSGMYLFDAVNDVYPTGIASSDISAINIRRTTTCRLVTDA